MSYKYIAWFGQLTITITKILTAWYPFIVPGVLVTGVEDKTSARHALTVGCRDVPDRQRDRHQSCATHIIYTEGHTSVCATHIIYTEGQTSGCATHIIYTEGQTSVMCNTYHLYRGTDISLCNTYHLYRGTDISHVQHISSIQRDRHQSCATHIIYTEGQTSVMCNTYHLYRGTDISLCNTYHLYRGTDIRLCNT